MGLFTKSCLHKIVYMAKWNIRLCKQVCMIEGYPDSIAYLNLQYFFSHYEYFSGLKIVACSNNLNQKILKM